MQNYSEIENIDKFDAQPHHRAINEEYQFYHAVREGDLEYIRNNCEHHSFENPEGMGVLSTNPLTNIKYHFCITAALLARHCIEGGMEMELAYRISDVYISKLDHCHDIASVVKWHEKMLFDFTGRMHMKNTNFTTSKSIQDAIEYIYKNVREPLSLNEIASVVSLSPCYLSRLFIKETGTSIKDYILDKKIEKAQNLLKYSDYSNAEISQFLSFASQSHFTSTFKRLTGMTPKKYKELYTRKIW